VSEGPEQGAAQARSSAEPSEQQAAAPAGPEQANVAAKVPEYSELSGSDQSAGSTPLNHLLDVNVTITAELGRVVQPLGELLKIGVGSVIELDRPVGEPVDLVAQGVRLARGEVVVVDDRFAIRIKEIADPKSGKQGGQKNRPEGNGNSAGN